MGTEAQTGQPKAAGLRGPGQVRKVLCISDMWLMERAISFHVARMSHSVPGVSLTLVTR